MGTVDDGLTEEDTQIGSKPGDELCDSVRYASLPKSSLPLLLSVSLSFSFTCSSSLLLFSQIIHNFSYLSTFDQHPQPHIHTHPVPYRPGDPFIRLFLLCFLSIIGSMFLLLHKQLINLPMPGASHLSLCTLLLLICMLVSLYAHFLFLYSLILSLRLSLQWLCVEYKLHRERMSCDIVFPLFTVINVSCYLAYACFH